MIDTDIAIVLNSFLFSIIDILNSFKCFKLLEFTN